MPCKTKHTDSPTELNNWTLKVDLPELQQKIDDYNLKQYTRFLVPLVIILTLFCGGAIMNSFKRAERLNYDVIEQLMMFVVGLLVLILKLMHREKWCLIGIPLMNLAMFIPPLLATFDALAPYGTTYECKPFDEIIRLLSSHIGLNFFMRYDFKWQLAFVEGRFLLTLLLFS